MTSSETPNPSGLNRREFLKDASLATGGLVLASLPFDLQALSLQANPILKIALVGCGGRGSGAVVQALIADPDTRLVSMADAFRDRVDSCYKYITSDKVDEAEGATDRLRTQIDVPEAHRFAGFDAYRKAIDLADVVILTSPPGFRPDHLEYAIQRGKHIFCEKPLATDANGIRRVLALLDSSRQQKLHIVVGLQRHYEKRYREIIGRVHAGEIGEVTSGQVYWNGSGVWVKDRLPGMSEMTYQMRNWYYFNWLCGDHIVEQHIHNIDVFNWAKMAYPVKAQGMGGRQVRTGKEFGEIYDHHYVEYTYADGTVMNSQCRHIKGCADKVYEQIVGTKGRAESNGSITDLKGNVIFRHNSKGDPNPYQVEHDELFASIRKGEVINDLENGAKSTLTAILGRMATYSGQVVTWDEAMNASEDLFPKTLDWNANPRSLPDANGHYKIPVPGVYKV